MSSAFKIQAVEGPTPEFSDTSYEPSFEASSSTDPVLAELLRREPIFHRREFGLERADFERMTAPEFWEVAHQAVATAVNS